MESQAMFLNCPACLDNDGALQCGLPTEAEARHIMNSTDGPLESAKISIGQTAANSGHSGSSTARPDRREKDTACTWPDRPVNTVGTVSRFPVLAGG